MLCKNILLPRRYSSVAPPGDDPEERRQYLARSSCRRCRTFLRFKRMAEKTRRTAAGFRRLPAKSTVCRIRCEFLDGRPVRTRTDWKARRAEIRQLFEKYDLGTFPPKPKLDRAVVLDETQGKGYLIRNVRLEFGPGGKGNHARAGDDSRRQRAASRF